MRLTSIKDLVYPSRADENELTAQFPSLWRFAVLKKARTLQRQCFDLPKPPKQPGFQATHASCSSESG
jgi:hypothetical protein